MGLRMGCLKGDRATQAAKEIEVLTNNDDRSGSDPIYSLDTDNGQELEVNEHAIDFE